MTRTRAAVVARTAGRAEWAATPGARTGRWAGSAAPPSAAPPRGSRAERAAPGALGSQATITANQIPGASSGAECSPDLTLAKSHADPFVRGSAGTYTLTVSNAGGSATSGTTTVTDTLPAGLTPTVASGA